MADGLWTVPPCGQRTATHKDWTRLRDTHTAHSPDGGDGVGTFSTVKWVLFQLSRFRLNGSSGSFFDCQMGTFSLDKNSRCSKSWTRASSTRSMLGWKGKQVAASREWEIREPGRTRSGSCF